MRPSPALLGVTLFGMLLPSAMAEPFMLVCHIAPAAGPQMLGSDVTFVVDTRKSLVNGRTAVIRDDMIFWEATTEKGSPYSTRISRQTGTIVVIDPKLGVQFVGNCEERGREPSKAPG